MNDLDSGAYIVVARELPAPSSMSFTLARDEGWPRDVEVSTQVRVTVSDVSLPDAKTKDTVCLRGAQQFISFFEETQKLFARGNPPQTEIYAPGSPW